jgi:SAM-dependent methyltransferase
MAWGDYEKWSFSIVRDVLAHFEFLLLCVVFSLRRRALEVGSGTGIQSCFVSYFGVEVVSIDLSRKVVKMASTVSRYYGAKNLSFVVADACHLPFRDHVYAACFSQGLLEHLDNETIGCIASEGIRVVTRMLLFSVPSNNFPQRDFGDERLMNPWQWKSVFSRFNAKVGYYKLDFESFKNSILSMKIPKPWHVLIQVRTWKPKHLIFKEQITELHANPSDLTHNLDERNSQRIGP